MRRRRQGLQVSTFPFLAVLLCTMGSLILLLLVIDRRARVVARVKALQAAAQAGALDETTEAARREEWERRRRALHDQLTREDEAVQAQVASLRRKEREHFDKASLERTQIDSLQQKIQTEQAHLTQWEQELTARRGQIAEKTQEAETSREGMKELTANLLRLEKTLAEVKAARLRQQQTYSLVPYHGKRGDRRKPIYIECAADGLVFHPDNKRIGGFGASPLDYRAEIERRLAHSSPSDESPGESGYLLMLVRPEGIGSYYRLIAALQGLKVDYGYEFIDRDWVLDFSGESAQPWMLAKKIKESPADDSTPGKIRRVIGVAEGRPLTSSSSGSAAAPSATGGINGTGDAGSGIKPFAGGPAFSPQGPRTGSGVGTITGLPPPNPNSGRAAGDSNSPPGQPGISSALAIGGGGGPSTLPGFGSSLSQGAPADRRAIGPGAASFGQGGDASAGGNGPEVSIGKPVPTRAGSETASATAPVDGQARLPAPTGTQPPTESTQENVRTPSSPGRNGNLGGGQATGGGAGPAEAGAGLPTTPNPLDRLAGPRKRPAGVSALRPFLFNRSRDWVINIDCSVDWLVLEGTGEWIAPLALIAADPSTNPLFKSVQAMIERRQATVPPGELPYRPLIRFRVHADGVRAYYLAYPALEALNVPMSRENVEPEDSGKP